MRKLWLITFLMFLGLLACNNLPEETGKIPQTNALVSTAEQSLPALFAPPMFGENSFGRYKLVSSSLMLYMNSYATFPESLEDFRASGYLFFEPGLEEFAYRKISEDKAETSFRLKLSRPHREGGVLKYPEGYSTFRQVWDLSHETRLPAARPPVRMSLKNAILSRIPKDPASAEEFRRLDRQFAFKYVLIVAAYNYQQETGRLPASLEELLAYGNLEKVEEGWTNPYTGKPMKNSAEPSPGDFYFGLKEDTGELVVGIYDRHSKPHKVRLGRDIPRP